VTGLAKRVPHTREARVQALAWQRNTLLTKFAPATSAFEGVFHTALQRRHRHERMQINVERDEGLRDFRANARNDGF